jgi:predicted MFS family arabinose efflux permease
MVSSSELLERTKAQIIAGMGGPARLRVILMLAAVLGLYMADRGTVSAVSDELKNTLKIGNTEIGLLLAVVSFIGATATLPMGVLVDRVSRRATLLVIVPMWCAAMIASGIASSYVLLLVSRIALGAVTAAAWPCVASLTGDFFPAGERAAIFGLIVAGELVGAGIGFFVSGEVSTLINWHWSFYAMALLAIALEWGLWRYLPEPQRGTQSLLRPEERDVEAASHPQKGNTEEDRPADGLSAVHKRMRQSGVDPRDELILREDPTKQSWWRAVRYLLQLPTYRLLIAVSALAYYYFAGVSAFGMIYFTQHYHLPRGVVSALVFVIGVGAIVGVNAGGRIAERLLKAGRLDARILVPAVMLFVAIPFFGFGFWTSTLWLGIFLVTIGAASLAAAIAPLDAARLDIVHPRLWGRGEAGRTAIRSALEGCAPLLFGALSTWLGGSDRGLMWTFVLMLVAMLGGAALAWPARRTYPRDVATAAASVEATARQDRKRRIG